VTSRLADVLLDLAVSIHSGKSLDRDRVNDCLRTIRDVMPSWSNSESIAKPDVAVMVAFFEQVESTSSSVPARFAGYLEEIRAAAAEINEALLGALTDVAVGRDQAISTARLAASDYEGDVLAAKLGMFQTTGYPEWPLQEARPGPTDPVWTIDLGRQRASLDGRGTIVVIDARDGRVIQMSKWIS
jgi:hypothetical protein